MKILVTGAGGQLGYDVCREIGEEAIGVGSKDFDITDRSATIAYIQNMCPDAIIHCAAYTAVDKAESEPELCHAVNALGTRYIAEAAADIDAKLLYISTDYVFDGALERPYEINDIPNPLSVYGHTKLEGENAVQKLLKRFIILRTSWVFGSNGGNFVKTMLRLGCERGSVSVVADQVGSPTYTPDLARLIALMIRSEKYGVYHATNEGFCSWYEFACEVFRAAGMDVPVIPITTAEYPTVAVRPMNSRLSKRSLADSGFGLLPAWQKAVKDFIDLFR